MALNVSTEARPIKFEFTKNLPAAKRIGLTIAPKVSVRADMVIEQAGGRELR